MAARALFLRENDTYVATELAQGAWDPGDANGGSVLALLGHCLEDVPSLVPMTPARMTADLMRPVPLHRPLTVTTSVVREGKKIQLVDLSLHVDGVLHARASALRLRDADLTGRDDLPAGSAGTVPQLVPPEAAESLRESSVSQAGFLWGVDMRYAPSRDGTTTGVWVRLEVPVVDGEAVRTSARAALAFDFANNINVAMPPGTATTINPDVSAHLLRPMTGEWVALTGGTRFSPSLGRGVSTASLSDLDGVFAEVTVCQLVQPRAR
ncbi:acyl-CoA thioesterase domain-containing protein [Trujillonella endophytica]|uniref:Thioesterase-like superfamily protein n=1 Tax=Trujillonella endophytica TaxID=673521 RepID=A0A1H8T319_9ACTN|nr:acyl-CoA thioesterase domain-containing protein [Trujillella endophytica]SEO85195.1 Thioesterase-like superfamily protein [Trujillella endophytica]